MVRAIEAAEPAVAGRIHFDDAPLPFPEKLQTTTWPPAFGPPPITRLEAGVAEAVETFARLAAAGVLGTAART